MKNKAESAPIRVLVVDDHPLMRHGTCRMLDDDAQIIVVGEAERGEEALALARDLHPDVLLLDLRLPGMGGMEVARALRQDLPEVRIIILSAYAHEVEIRMLFAIGVDGYLLKSASGEELIASVRAVMAGDQVVDKEITAQTPTDSARLGVAANLTLSEREREVLALLARGARNKEVAQHLGIKTATVETHISHAIAKLGSRSRAEAICRAVQHGIIVLEE